MTPESLRECCQEARTAFYGLGSIGRRLTNLRTNARTPSHLGLFLAANLISRRELASKIGHPLGAAPRGVHPLTTGLAATGVPYARPPMPP
jgi:hypothetical protein